MPDTESVLNIHVRNELPEAISIVIQGCVPSVAEIPATFTDADGRVRIRSLAHETAAAPAGGVGPFSTSTYSWSNVSNGSYIYHSGAHAAVQVQMGLYGAVKKDLRPGVAYDPDCIVNGNEHNYHSDAILFYSEVDPALHAAVSAGTFTGSTLNYLPKYFLINGESNPVLPTFERYEKVLLRFFSASLKNHVPTFKNTYVKVIAEDGNLYPYSREQYSLLLHALKTFDVTFTSTEAGTFPIFDSRRYLSDADVPGGGMLAELTVGNTITAELTVSANHMSQTVNQGDPATFAVFVENTGIADVSNITVISEECDPLPVNSGGFNVGDSNIDNVLQNLEIWEYTCTLEEVGETISSKTEAEGSDPTGGDVGSNQVSPEIIVIEN